MVYQGTPGKLGGYVGRLNWVRGNSASFTFVDFGTVIFDENGHGDNDKVSVQLYKDNRGLYFSTGSFTTPANWISSGAIVTIKPKPEEIKAPEAQAQQAPDTKLISATSTTETAKQGDKVTLTGIEIVRTDRCNDSSRDCYYNGKTTYRLWQNGSPLGENYVYERPSAMGTPPLSGAIKFTFDIGLAREWNIAYVERTQSEDKIWQSIKDYEAAQAAKQEAAKKAMLSSPTAQFATKPAPAPTPAPSTTPVEKPLIPSWPGLPTVPAPAPAPAPAPKPTPLVIQPAPTPTPATAPKPAPTPAPVTVSSPAPVQTPTQSTPPTTVPQLIPAWPGVPKIEPKPITPPTPSQETPKPAVPYIPPPAPTGKGKIVSLTVQQGGYSIFEPCGNVVLFPYSVAAGKFVCITVKIKNEGNGEGEFRAYLNKPSGETIDKEPDLFWKNLQPGQTYEMTLNAFVPSDGLFKPVLEVRRYENAVDESRILEFNASGTAPIVPGLPPIVEPVKKAIEEVSQKIAPFVPGTPAPPAEAGEPKPSTPEPKDDPETTPFPELLAVIAAIVVFMMLRK